MTTSTVQTEIEKFLGQGDGPALHRRRLDGFA